MSTSEPKTREQALEYVLTQVGIEKQNQAAYLTIGSLNRLAFTLDDVLETTAKNKIDFELLLAAKLWIRRYLSDNDG